MEQKINFVKRILKFFFFINKVLLINILFDTVPFVRAKVFFLFHLYLLYWKFFLPIFYYCVLVHLQKCFENLIFMSGP